MFNPSKLLLIDGNHLCHRVYWTHKQLSHRGKPVAVLYGFLRSLISLKKKYADSLFVIAWDAGYARRKLESENAVKAGIISSAYKENRKVDDEVKLEQIRSIHSQRDELEEVLNYVKVVQVCVDGVEADDLIYSYVLQNWKAGGESFVITGDKDYYQLLKDKVSLYDPLKSETWTRDRFVEEFGFEPELWVDVGAIAGDTSDNIPGIPGWGERSAIKYVKQYGDIDSIMEALQAKEKKGKKEQVFLENVDRLKVCKSLKQMDVVEPLPKLRFRRNHSKDALEKFMIDFRFISLMKDTWRLVS
jgi:DNA polymerase-1